MNKKIKSFSFFYLSLFIFVFNGCQPAAQQTNEQGSFGNASTNADIHANNTPTEWYYGVWTNKSFADAVVRQNAPYNRFNCTEFAISPEMPDSLWVVRCQTDVALMPFQRKGRDTLLIAQWQQKGVSLVRIDSTTLSFIDHNNGNQSELFVRANPQYVEKETIPPFRYAHRRLLNSSLIAGDYAIAYPKNAAGKEVHFGEDGSLSGLSNFNKYTLWVGGTQGTSCKENVLSFNNGEIDTLYGWQKSADSLFLISLQNAKKSDKNLTYQYSKVAIKMVRRRENFIGN